MKTTGKSHRIIPEYRKIVRIPRRYKPFFWDCPEGKVYLEKFILRILTYGNFDDLKDVYRRYPEETYHIALKYPEIKRGVRFWVKLWRKQGLRD